jgi:hypothetical protein
MLGIAGDPRRRFGAILSSFFSGAGILFTVTPFSFYLPFLDLFFLVCRLSGVVRAFLSFLRGVCPVGWSNEGGISLEA